MDSLLKAPVRNVFLSDGTRAHLSDFYSERPLALIFVRHLGCVFCREQVVELRDYTELNLAFVTPTTPKESEEFALRIGVRHPLFAEPERDLYREFGLGEGRLGQFASPHVIASGFRATMRVGMNGRPIGNPFQLGGTFVVATDGRIAFAKPARDAADHPTPDEIRLALKQAENQ